MYVCVYICICKYLKFFARKQQTLMLHNFNNTTITKAITTYLEKNTKKKPKKKLNLTEIP